MLRRILFFIPSLLFIALIGFIIAVNAPGDPVQTLLHDVTGNNNYTSLTVAKEQEKQLRHRLGLDLPVFYFSMHSLAESKATDKFNNSNIYNSKSSWRNYIPVISFHLHNQFHRWLFGDYEFSKGIIRGDFGISYTTQQPVIEVLQPKIKWSLLLSIASLIISLIIAIPLGTYSVFHPESYINKFISGFKNFAFATPVFWLATLLLILFANPSLLKIFPASGVQPSEGFGDAAFFKRILISSWYLILPIVCYCYSSIALLAATVQSSLKQTMTEEYIKTAFAKGLSLKQVVNRHAMRNVLLPLITLIANFFPAALGGSVIIENIFSIPGMGNEITNAIYTQNYPVIVAVVTITGFLTLSGYLLADIVYRIADPRIRFANEN